MQIINRKKATVLVYALLLVSLALMLAVVVLNSSTTMSLNHELRQYKYSFATFFREDSKRIFDYALVLNGNWEGYSDIISCPTTVSMSWSTLSWTLATSLIIRNSTDYSCVWVYSWKELEIFFNSWATDLETASYDWWSVGLVASGVWKQATANFSDTDSTFLDFSTTAYAIADGYDDNINSDDYTPFSLSGSLYPDNYQDDDDNHRRIKIWNLLPEETEKQIFWSNDLMSDYIGQNINNSWSLITNIGDASWGHMFLEAKNNFTLDIYVLDKTSFNEFEDIKIIEKKSWAGLLSWSGYIADVSWNLSLTGALGWSEMLFDYQNYDYAIFLSNNDTSSLEYSLAWIDALSGSWLYIVPVDDSLNSTIEYFGQGLLKWDDWIFMHSERKIQAPK